MGSTILELTEVTKLYGKSVKAVDALNLKIEAGEFFSLLGPSGCGKTTTLRLIAGLESPDAGQISYQGIVVASRERHVFVPPEKRHMGMVFQSYAIWPHMTVFENVAYALRLRRVKNGVIREKVLAMLDTVNLHGLAERQATQLSGGQQQRVALARALIHEPKLLLLDEPFSNLDTALREQMRIEMKLLQKRLGVTMILVTHDQTEALSLSDRIAIMRGGRSEQIGSPQELYHHPVNAYVRDFLGRALLFDGTMGARDGNGLLRVELTSTGEQVVAAPPANEMVPAPGEAVVLMIRPEHLRLRRQTAAPSAPSAFAGTVEALLFMGTHTDARVTLHGGQTAVVSLASVDEIREGDAIAIEAPPEELALWRR